MSVRYDHNRGRAARDWVRAILSSARAVLVVAAVVVVACVVVEPRHGRPHPWKQVAPMVPRA